MDQNQARQHTDADKQRECRRPPERSVRRDLLIDFLVDVSIYLGRRELAKKDHTAK